MAHSSHGTLEMAVPLVLGVFPKNDTFSQYTLKMFLSLITVETCLRKGKITISEWGKHLTKCEFFRNRNPCWLQAKWSGWNQEVEKLSFSTQFFQKVLIEEWKLQFVKAETTFREQHYYFLYVCFVLNFFISDLLRVSYSEAQMKSRE